MLYYTQESLYSPITSSNFPYWLLSDRHPFTWSHASKLFSLGLQQGRVHIRLLNVLLLFVFFIPVQSGDIWFVKLWSCERHMMCHEDRTTTIHFSSQHLLAPQSCGGWTALFGAVFANAHHEMVEALMCGGINLVWQAGRMLHSSLSHSTAVIHHAARLLPAVMNDWWDLLIPSSALP